MTLKMISINYSNIERLDQQIGKLIQELKEDNLYENTIIFLVIMGDHSRDIKDLFMIQEFDVH